MPAFSYEAMSASGQKSKGVIEADSIKAARSQLRLKQLVPLTVSPYQNTTSEAGIERFFNKKAFTRSSLTIWINQLAGLVNAGLPLERALTSLAQEADKPEKRLLIAAVRAEVNGGAPLATAMAQYPGEFPSVYRAVIDAGEQSGQLGTVLARLAQDMESAQNLRSKLIGAALYPLIVCCVSILIVFFLLGYVVPQVANVFAGTHHDLPVLTRIMLTLGNGVKNHWLVLIGGLFLIALIAFWLWRKPLFRDRFDAFWLKVPIVGKLSMSYNAAQFASTLSMLCAAGVPILRAIQAAADTLGNRSMRMDALDVVVLVKEGAPLASALAQKKRFPAIVSMFARLGEQTGQLPKMLERAAGQLSTEVQRRAMNLATLLEPLLIVSMGMIVMLIVLSVMMPIIQLNGLVGQ